MAPVSVVGSAIHGDFFTVTGDRIPRNVTLVFETDDRRVEFAPDLVRPDWVWTAELPVEIPPGDNRLTLRAPNRRRRSPPATVTVAAGAHETVRVFNPGASKPDPYTVAFIANPAILRPGGAVEPDPALSDRRRFHWKVRFCLRNLLELDEDLLRQFDPAIRYVAVFDPTAAPILANALVEEDAPSGILVTRRRAVDPFLAARNVEADVVIVLHGDDRFERGYAWPTLDDPARGGVPFTYDRTQGVHLQHALVPGSVALPMIATSGPIALHEFCHAAASIDSGAVIDLYNDLNLTLPANVNLPGVPTDLRVNKKWRQQARDPIPSQFAVYDGRPFPADPQRDGLGYAPGWSSYHPGPIDGRRPNLMDYYTWALQPKSCRLDRLTHTWLSARIQAKLAR